MLGSDSENKKQIFIVKASGDREIFDSGKLKFSLVNSGAHIDMVNSIVLDIENWIYSGASTKEIYKRAFAILRKETTNVALRYNLKQAIMELGPTGYPFESFVGQIFEKQSYKVQVGIVIEGHSVSHEMDVVASLNNMQNLIECKYHKDQGKPVSVQVPLYVHSRVNDIVRRRKQLPEFKSYRFYAGIVTNTLFSPDSIKYAEANSIKLLAWNYPPGRGLKYMVETLKMYPITILQQLTVKQKNILKTKGIVICSQLLKDKGILEKFNLSEKKYKLVIKEIKSICEEHK